MTGIKTSRLTIGITGGIGSGKSTVTELLANRGVAIVDADVIARLVVEPGSEALDEIATHFGHDILRADNTLDRVALRARVFQDDAERKWLENLLHPLIRTEIIQQLEASDGPYSVLSSPLLLETGQNSLVDSVLLIDTNEALQVERTQKRDNLDEQAVAAIMASQWPRERRKERADFIIVNDGSLSDLESVVDKMHKQFLDLAVLKAAKQK